MSPSKESTAGGRPSPLRIHRDSHLIHKAHSPPPPRSHSSTSSSSNSVASSGCNSHHHHHHHQQQQQQRHPVIIYTHSPKIIHTQPRDFMALVQKLTGMSRSEDEGGRSTRPRQEVGAPSDCDGPAAVSAGNDVDSTSTSENSGDEDAPGGQLLAPAPAAVSRPVVFDPSSNLFLADAPIFTPTACDLYSSPRHYYRCPDAGVYPYNVGSSISPSVMEIMKTFDDY